MAKISINLLPPEFTQQELQRSKFYKVQAIGVATVLVMTFLTSLTLALRILQSANIKQVQTKLNQAEQRVLGLKSTQGSLLLLKNRLTTISQYLGTPSKQTSLYKLIDKLMPSSVSVNALSIDKTGAVVMTILAPDSLSLDNLMTNLTSAEENGDKIKEVSIESLNRGRDGIYRISLKVKAKL